jgi:hypothetical protein
MAAEPVSGRVERFDGLVGWSKGRSEHMKRIAIVLATLALLVLTAPTASADVANFDLFSGRGTIEKAEIIAAFGWTGKQFNNRAYDVVLRRDVAQSYDISCVTAEARSIARSSLRTTTCMPIPR